MQILKAIVKFGREEPVRAMALVNAAIVLAVAFGAHLSTQQIAAVAGFAAVVLGLGGELVRQSVTPLATLPPGTAAKIADASAARAADTPPKP